MVPCGKCAACRKQRAAEWGARMTHEAAYYEYSVFVTLTYEDKQLPEPADVSKRELQLFFKRLRKALGERRVKYYACGEYGEVYGRPHYHAAIFGLRPCGACPSCCKGERGGGAPRERAKGDCKVLLDAWPYGFVHVDDVTAASTRYIAGYIEKALYVPELRGRARPFSLMSKGIGRRYAEDHERQIMSMKGLTIDGKRVCLPKYYSKRVLEIPTEVLLEWSEEREVERSEHYLGKYHGEDDFADLRVMKALEAHAAQTERNLKAREALKERDYEA